MKRQILNFICYTVGAGAILSLYLIIPLVLVVGIAFSAPLLKMLVAILILAIAEFVICYIMCRTTLKQKSSSPQLTFEPIGQPVASAPASASMPFVSIIVPTHEEEPGLRHCVISLLQQTYDPYEVVVVDANATDKVERVLDDVADSHPNGDKLWILQLQKHQMPEQHTDKWHPLHYGMREARGEWLLLLDTYTWYSPLAVHTAITKALAENTDLLYSNGLRLLHRQSLARSRTVHALPTVAAIEKYGS